jgi:hypothetical protein
MRATLAVRSCELNAEFCFSILRVRMVAGGGRIYAARAQRPSTSYLKVAPWRNLEKTGPLVAWSDLLVTSLQARCWHYDSSGLSDRLKRAGELPHTVIGLRLSTGAYVFAIG